MDGCVEDFIFNDTNMYTTDSTNRLDFDVMVTAAHRASTQEKPVGDEDPPQIQCSMILVQYRTSFYRHEILTDIVLEALNWICWNF